MVTDRLIAELHHAAAYLSTLPYSRIASLNGAPWFEEVGLPDESQPGNYCQTAAEVIDCFVEDGVDVLHVMLFARDEYREFVTNMFFYNNNALYWNRNIFEYINGRPELIPNNRNEP